MEASLIYEIIGYAASILVAISLTMSSILKLRIINLVGAFFFTIYGLVIRAYPVAAVNFFIVLINLYYLYEIFTAKEYFELLQVRPESDYLAYFLKHYDREIQRFQPGFAYTATEETLIFFILRNMVPSGLFIGRVLEPGRLKVELDFVIPGYRDFKISKFLFQEKADFFTGRGIQEIVSPAGTEAHPKYLRRMGFIPRLEADGQWCFHLKLTEPAARGEAATPRTTMGRK